MFSMSKNKRLLFASLMALCTTNNSFSMNDNQDNEKDEKQEIKEVTEEVTDKKPKLSKEKQLVLNLKIVTYLLFGDFFESFKKGALKKITSNVFQSLLYLIFLSAQKFPSIYHPWLTEENHSKP